MVKTGVIPIKDKTIIYGYESTFPLNPNLYNNGTPYTHMLYFPTQFNTLQMVIWRLAGIVPIKK